MDTRDLKGLYGNIPLCSIILRRQALVRRQGERLLTSLSGRSLKDEPGEELRYS